MRKRFFGFTTIWVLILGSFLFAGQDSGNNKKKAADLVEQCKTLIRKGEVDKAIQSAEKAVELDKDISNNHYWLGMAYRAKARPLKSGMEKVLLAKKFVKAFETAVKLDGKNVGAHIQLAGFLTEAPPIVGGSIEKAKTHAAEILKLRPISGYFAYGRIYLKENKLDEVGESIKKAYTLHLDLKKKNPGQRTGFEPIFVNDYGYKLLQAKQFDKAISFFKMNVELYPGYFNPWDSLAEAYMIKGDKKLALDNYKKALELNPNKTDFEKKAYQAQQGYIKKLEEELKQ
jgi:tetratricopeptide (TPR) repeat protein